MDRALKWLKKFALRKLNSFRSVNIDVVMQHISKEFESLLVTFLKLHRTVIRKRADRRRNDPRFEDTTPLWDIQR